jgi:hypothetical protein
LTGNYLILISKDTTDDSNKAQLDTLLLIAKLINHLSQIQLIDITTARLDNLSTYLISSNSVQVQLQNIYPTRGSNLGRDKLNERQQKILYLITKIKEILDIPGNENLKKRIIYLLHAFKRSGDWMQTIDAMTLETATTLYNFLAYTGPGTGAPVINITEDPNTIIYTADGAYLATILAFNSYLLYLQDLSQSETTYKIKFIFHTDNIIITNLPNYKILTDRLEYGLITEPSSVAVASSTSSTPP